MSVPGSGNQGLTLLEILVAVIILALIIGGFANIFISSKSYLIHSRSLMTAAELARYFLAPLQANISQDVWNTSWLGTGGTKVGTSFGTTQMVPGGFVYNYTPTFNITANYPISNLSRVVLNITWNEIAP